MHLVIPGLNSPGFGTRWQYGHYKRFNRAKRHKSGHERQFIFTTVHPEYFHPDVPFLDLVVGALQSLSFLAFVDWARGSFCDSSSKTGCSVLFDRAKADDGSPDDEPLRYPSQSDDSGVNLKRTFGILLIAMLAALLTLDAVYWWLVLVFFSWLLSPHQAMRAPIDDAVSEPSNAVPAMDESLGLDSLVANLYRNPGTASGRSW